MNGSHGVRRSAWVVYESMFGNTRDVADAVAGGLSASHEVEVHEVGHVPPLPDGLDLLVVGGPTHAFGLSRPATRADAARTSGRAVVSADHGLREWLEALRFPGPRPAVAAFDTRVERPRMPGSAARKAVRRLRHLGCVEVAATKSFWVMGTQGPLVAGELDRAARWGRALGAKTAGSAADERIP